jgi:hypothetical protein
MAGIYKLGGEDLEMELKSLKREKHFRMLNDLI